MTHTSSSVSLKMVLSTAPTDTPREDQSNIEQRAVSVFREINSRYPNYTKIAENLSIEQRSILPIGLNELPTLAQSATSYLETVEGGFLSNEDHWRNLQDAVYDVIDRFIRTLGIDSLLAAKEGMIPSSLNRNAVLALITLLATISSMLVTAGVANAPIIVMGVFAGFVLFTVLHTTFHAAFRSLPDGQNFTQLRHKGQLSLVPGRGAEIELAINGLRANKCVKILGYSGAGKTEVAKGIAYRMGELDDYKTKQIIYFNMADLIKEDKGLLAEESALDAIYNKIKGHGEDYIFILDELGALGKNLTIIDRLKTKLAAGNRRDYPLVIGITTFKEDAQYIQSDLALDRRFPMQVSLQNTTPANTFTILYGHLLRKQPTVLKSTEVLKYIVRKTNELGMDNLRAASNETTPDSDSIFARDELAAQTGSITVQPGAAIHVLDLARACCTPTYHTDARKEAAKAADRVSTANAAISLSIGSEEGLSELLNKASEASLAARTAQSLCTKQQATTEKLWKELEALLKVEKDFYKTAIKANEAKGPKQAALLKEAALIRKCMIQLKTNIKAAATPGVQIELTTKLIDEIIEKNKADILKSFVEVAKQPPNKESNPIIRLDQVAQKLAEVAQLLSLQAKKVDGSPNSPESSSTS